MSVSTGMWMFQDFLLFACVYLFLLPLQAMSGKKIKNAVILVLALIILQLICFSLPEIRKHMAVEFIIRLLMLCITVCMIYGKICWDALYASIWAIMVYYCVNILWNSLDEVLRLTTRSQELRFIGYLIFFAATYAVAELTLFRWMPRNGEYQAGPRRTLSAAAILILSQYSSYNYYTSGGQSNLAIMVQIYCVTFLYLQSELFEKSAINQELTLMERMWYQQKRQYEIAKDQMQVIDRKCHDLKYQVAAMRHIDNPAEREKNLNELEKSIRIYDAIVKTGNDILDTLLSEKSLVCEARDIEIHCVIDGAKLSFLDPIDIYALFGNAIDNAIECVEKFPEKEQRFIDICVTEKQHFLYIRFSNPIQRQPEYENDLPKTTKKNKQYHGIGLKSIRQIAKKYGGDISVVTELGCFNLEVLLPER